MNHSCKFVYDSFSNECQDICFLSTAFDLAFIWGRHLNGQVIIEILENPE